MPVMNDDISQSAKSLPPQEGEDPSPWFRPLLAYSSPAEGGPGVSEERPVEASMPPSTDDSTESLTPRVRLSRLIKPFTSPDRRTEGGWEGDDEFMLMSLLVCKLGD